MVDGGTLVHPPSVTSVRVQFVHGLEGSPTGRKARHFAERFDALTPAMDTGDFEASVRVQAEALERFRPDVLVGSSFGGGVVVALLQRGAWRGPTLLLAQAAVRMGLPLELPAGVPVWLVHGAHDEIVDPADSRALAATSPDTARLIEVDDDHMLGRVLDAGRIEAWVRELAGASLDSAPPHPSTPRSE